MAPPAFQALGPKEARVAVNKEIHALGSRKQWQGSVSMLKKMAIAHMQADAFSFTSALGACAWRRALHGTFAASRASHVVHNAAAAACERGNAWQMGWALVGELGQALLEPSAASFSVVLTWRKALAAAPTALDTMRRRALRVGELSLGKTIAVFSVSGGWQLAAGVLQDMGPAALRANQICRSAAATALQRGGRWRQALRLCDASRADAVGLGAAISAAALGGWSLALALNTQGMSVVGASTAITACERAACWPQALALLWGMAKANHVSFNAAISACEKAGQWELALALLKATSRRSLADQTSWNAAVSACEKARRWQMALALLVAAPARDTVGINAAISACEKCGAWEAALALLASMPAHRAWTSEVSFSASISACEKGGQWPFALLLLSQMSDVQLAPNEFSFSAALTACAAAAAWRQVLAVLRRMEAQQVPPTGDLLVRAALSALDPPSCRRALAATERWATDPRKRSPRDRRLGEVEGGSESLVGEGQCRPVSQLEAWRKDPKALTSFLRASTPDVIAEVLALGLPLNLFHYNAMLAAYAKRRAWLGALDLASSFGRRRAQPDVVSFNSAISVCSWGMALALLARLAAGCRPDVFTGNSCLASFGSGGSWRGAAGLLAGFAFQGAAGFPDTVSWACLVNACTDTWDQALSALAASSASGCASEVAYHSAMKAVGPLERGWRLVSELLAQLRLRNLRLSGRTWGAASGGRWRFALQMPCSQVVCGNLLAAQASDEAWRQAAASLARMPRRRLAPNEICVSSCIGAAARASAWAVAFRMFHGRRQLDEIAAGNVLLADGAAAWRHVLGTLSAMKEMGLELSPTCGTSVAGSCAGAHAWRPAVGLLKSFEGQLNTITCNAVLGACAASGQWQMALHLLEAMPALRLRPDRASHAVFLTSLPSKSWQLALEVLARMSSQSVEADAGTCNAAISVCSKGVQWQHALQLLSAMPSRRIAATAVSYCAGIDACTSAGQVGAGRCLLRDMPKDFRDSVPLIWAMASLGVKDLPLLATSLAASAEMLDRLPLKEVSILAWSLRMLSLECPTICLRLLERGAAEIHRFPPEELLRLAWGLMHRAGFDFARLAQERAARLLDESLAGEGPTSSRTLYLSEVALGIVWSCAFAGKKLLRPKLRGALLRLGAALDASQKLPTPGAAADGVSAPASAAPGPRVVLDLPDRRVVFKPPGWEVYDGHVELQLRRFLQAQGSGPGALRCPILEDARHSCGFLHRLDVPSSGLILAAKTYEAFYDLQVQLHGGALRRDYVALCHGWASRARVILAPVQVVQDAITSAGAGRPARSKMKVLGALGHRNGGAATLAALRLGSGRRHQLRSHLAHIGHPVWTDGKYTAAPTHSSDAAVCGRNFLHRYRLAFGARAERLAQPREVLEPPPADLLRALSAFWAKGAVSAQRLRGLAGLGDWARLVSLERQRREKEMFNELEVSGYGPGGAAVVIEAVTDNTNRTRSVIKDAFKSVNGEGLLAALAGLFDPCGNRPPS
ncbi:unnamed protein product [Effrenium voratum]|nr:unnamed protein product [Effrenium voratum]